MSMISGIGNTLYNTFVKDPVQFWTGKKDSEEITAKDVAKAYTIGITSPVWAPLALLSGCSVHDEGYVAEDSGTDGTVTDDGIDTPIEPEIPEDATGIEPGGPGVIITQEFLVKSLGNKVQSGEPISTPAISYAGSTVADQSVQIYFESVPLHVFEELADEHADGVVPDHILENLDKIDGLIDTTIVPHNPFEEAQQVNIGTAANPVYILDPVNENHRIPVFMGEVQLVDLTGKIWGHPEYVCGVNDLYVVPEDCTAEEECDEDNPDVCYEVTKMSVCSHDEAYDHLCNDYRIGPENSTVYPPFGFTAPPEAYDNNILNIIQRSILTAHGENYIEGHDYTLAGRIRLVIE